MHNVQEGDWEEDLWCAHTGMDSTDDYCYATEKKIKKEKPLSLEERLRKMMQNQTDSGCEGKV